MAAEAERGAKVKMQCFMYTSCNLKFFQFAYTVMAQSFFNEGA